MFNFAETEPAQERKFLKPGVHTVKVTKGEFGTAKSAKKTPFVALTFSTKEGFFITENFMITPDSLPRLQYLHEAWKGEKLTKQFKTAEEVAKYFISLFTKKSPAKKIIVGGEINGKITYGNLPYSGFVVTDEADLEEGEFEEGDDNWKKYVKKSTRTTAASGKPQGLLSEEGSDEEPESDSGEEDDENPW